MNIKNMLYISVEYQKKSLSNVPRKNLNKNSFRNQLFFNCFIATDIISILKKDIEKIVIC